MSASELKVSGILTYWDPADCRYADLRASAKSLGLMGFLPPRPSLAAAAKRILLSLFDCGQTYRLSHLRALKGYQIDRLVRHDSASGEAANDYLPVFRVQFVDARGARLPDPGFRVTLSAVPDIADAQSRFEEAMRDARGILGRYKASRFLALSLSSLWGISLRDRGGVYWLPADKADRWQQIIGAVSAAAATPFGAHTIQLVHDAASIAAVVASVRHEVAKDIDELSATLTATATSKTVVKARKDADGLQQRLNHYSSLFGDSFAELQERAKAVRALAIKAALEAAVSGTKGILI